SAALRNRGLGICVPSLKLAAAFTPKSNGCSSIERKVELLYKVEMAARIDTIVRILKLRELLFGIA
ncbi:MAG: hypothetical protein QNJ72_25610, partial [Pleurocapsa sp. MO_226.B13]|nr:hypothetical protein [Pleurocapsa sp. MO_226.B13]